MKINHTFVLFIATKSVVKQGWILWNNDSALFSRVTITTKSTVYDPKINT